MSDQSSQKVRCPWVGQGKDFYDRYHDTEWGVPAYKGKKTEKRLTRSATETKTTGPPARPQQSCTPFGTE